MHHRYHYYLTRIEFFYQNIHRQDSHNILLPIHIILHKPLLGQMLTLPKFPNLHVEKHFLTMLNYFFEYDLIFQMFEKISSHHHFHVMVHAVAVGVPLLIIDNLLKNHLLILVVLIDLLFHPEVFEIAS